MKGVVWTHWGWAPATGPLYLPFVVVFNFFMISGLRHLVKATRGIASPFRRTRGTLIMLGTLISLAGGFIDSARFVAAKYIPAAEQVYPMGIPANMVFALMLGPSIVRYRLFAVDLAVKKAAVYGVVGTAVTGVLYTVTRTIERAFNLADIDTIWLVVPLGFVITVLLTPWGQHLEDRIHRLMFSKPQGCYKTLLSLGKRMSAILNFTDLVDTLLHGLCRGVPVTNATLLFYDATTNAFASYPEETPLAPAADV